MSEPAGDVTALLQRWTEGDSAALDELMPEVYRELRKIARGYLRRERVDHTLQATALVNEAYLRLIDQSRVAWSSRSHFFAIAAQMMRRILVDHARKRRADKRGGPETKLALDDARDAARGRDVDLVALDDAMADLERLDPRQCRIVELRYFAGLTIDEVAEVLDLSPATVKRDWTAARAFLHRQLS